jgi:ketosteroid isomerase-like protein
MSHGNVELARRALAKFIEVDEGLIDLQRLEEFFAPDAITTFSSGFLQDETILHGTDEFLEFRASWMEAFEDWSYEAKEVLDAGANRVVVTLYQRGKPRGGGDSWVEMHYGLIYTFEDGLIVRVHFYATPEEALEAAGLSE